MIKIEKLEFSNSGRKINYNYSYDKSIAKYFNSKESFFCEYQVNVSKVPESIAIIPLLANVSPIAWFLGIDIYLNELDETFYQSLLNLKIEFSKFYSNIKTESKIHVEKLVKNKIEGSKTGMLFSGGLDSFESLTRNIDKDPFLISVLGADIEISDEERWKDFDKFNQEEEIINKSKLQYVISNLRTFYTYEVDLLVDVGWWGKVQHGIALISLIAPLSHVFQISTVFIASSNTKDVKFGWGSSLDIDEKVKWATQEVKHDGVEFKRTEKIQNIVDFVKNTGKQFKLRVCYSELRQGYNCSKCAKCQRTILGIILTGENPCDYGFSIQEDFYNLLFDNFKKQSYVTVGVKDEWICLQDKAKQISKPFIIKNKIDEKRIIDKFGSLNLDDFFIQNESSFQKKSKWKFKIISMYPNLFKFYLKVRHRNL